MAEREQFHQDIVAAETTDDGKQRILGDYKEYFDSPELSGVGDYEREKTPDELAAIELVKEFGDNLAKSAGAVDFPVSERNFHVIPQNKWPEREHETSGIFNTRYQQIAIKDQGSLLGFAKSACHEYLHMKSFGKLQLTSENRAATDSRVGLTVVSRQGDREFFRLLNEAVAEEMAKSFIDHVQTNGLFAEEVSQTATLRAQYGSNFPNEDGTPFFDRELYYAKLLETDDSKTTITGLHFSKVQEREALNTLVAKIVERDQGTERDDEEVRWQFVKGMMTGNILSIGKMIDRTFGSGTFRKIGEQSDPSGLQKIVNSL